MKLIEVPVVVGDMVYTIQPCKWAGNTVIDEANILCGKVCQLMQKSDGNWKFQVSGYDESGRFTAAFHNWFFMQDIGKTVFFSYNEADSALINKPNERG